MSTTAHPSPAGRRLAQLTLLATGVVYGDIGTSPLYAFRECFKPEYGLAPDPANIYGVLSLIVWSLIIVVSVKYIVFIMRADNEGEGGILALLALIRQQHRRDVDTKRKKIITWLGLIGAALLYGDGIITPAISVLGATEGLEVVSPTFKRLVVPITIGVLAALFFFQRRGTDKVGKIFGPVMVIWFIVIGALGFREIMFAPEILQAINPAFGFRFFLTHGVHAFVLLGAVVLVVTGAEALYADMGHFGKRPIRLAWFVFVLPALLLNYFGQGALVLREPASSANPFYLLAPRLMLYPMIALATAAAIIASQALISGAFSLSQQSVQLGFSPRVNIIHTSAHEAGQIYVPEVNRALAIGTILVVLMFKSSSALGAAYGIAVTGTMAITTILFYVLARSRWNWSILKAGSLAAVFLIIDLAFFFANALKVMEGGWVPLVVALGLFILMTTWQRGKAIVTARLKEGSLPLEMFLSSVAEHKPVRVPGTAVFMTSDPTGAPLVLLHHVKHNKVLHENVVILSIKTEQVPTVPESERLDVQCLPERFGRIKARYGFMETPNVPELLAATASHGIIAKPGDTTYYLGRERLIFDPKQRGLANWRKHLFIFMSRNSRSATEFYQIPPNRVVELGAQFEF
ncbi:MAG: potassium transporter Kup [Gemmatimonadaceae bacterium]|nr:potassium transporter Kup [Gemmatimonadaceae bacterium]